MFVFLEELLVFWAIANNLQNSTFCVQGDLYQTDILNFNVDSLLFLDSFVFFFFKGKMRKNFQNGRGFSGESQD